MLFTGSVERKKDIHTPNVYAVDLDPELLCNCESSTYIISRSAEGISGKRSRPARDIRSSLYNLHDSMNHQDIIGIMRMI